MTHQIECPPYLDMPALFELAQTIQQAPAASHYEFDFRRPPFAKPFLMLYLASAINRLRLTKPEATFTTLTSRSDSCAYMSHLGFFDACGLVDAHYQPMGSPGAGINYIPITTWQVSELRQQARQEFREIGELIEKQAEEMARVLTRQQRGDLVDILVYSLREIMRNVVEHSESDTLMYCAQFWPQKNEVEVAILDAGIGITHSLRQNPHLKANNDYDALKLSVLPGISSKAFRGKHRNPHDVWANTGYGLYMVRRLCERVARSSSPVGMQRCTCATMSHVNIIVIRGERPFPCTLT